MKTIHSLLNLGQFVPASADICQTSAINISFRNLYVEYSTGCRGEELWKSHGLKRALLSKWHPRALEKALAAYFGAALEVVRREMRITVLNTCTKEKIVVKTAA